jgi:hypothetical protein
MMSDSGRWFTLHAALSPYMPCSCWWDISKDIQLQQLCEFFWLQDHRNVPWMCENWTMIVHTGERQVPCHEDILAALWRESCGEEVKPPAHSHPDTTQMWSLHFKMTIRKWSKMVTMIQKQIAWTPNPEPCWDAWATLSGSKAPIRIKSLTPWIPNQWKASPEHVTLRKLEGCHHSHSCCHCLQTYLQDILQTK